MSPRDFVLASFVAAIAIGLSASDANVATGQAPAKEFLPGPCQVLCVTHANPERVGKYHCPVCEQGLHPVVLVFFREIEEPAKPLPALLKKLDEVISKHPQARMGACAVLLNDGEYRDALLTKFDTSAKTADLKLNKAIDARTLKERQLQDLAKQADFKRLTLSLSISAGPEDYKIPKDREIIIWVAHKHEVVAKFAFPKGKLGAAESQQVLQAVEATAVAAEKVAGRKK